MFSGSDSFQTFSQSVYKFCLAKVYLVELEFLVCQGPVGTLRCLFMIGYEEVGVRFASVEYISGIVECYSAVFFKLFTYAHLENEPV